MALTEGQKAPAFTLPDAEGKPVRLSDFKGKNVVLYFYPKDDTSGCTLEACNFRDEAADFRGLDAVILGVSPDSSAAHQKFKAKYKLHFSLLSDEKRQVVETYGVWKEKSMYGRKYMGVERTTFLIDPQGKIKKIFPKVKVPGHSEAVRDALQS